MTTPAQLNQLHRLLGLLTMMVAPVLVVLGYLPFALLMFLGLLVATYVLTGNKAEQQPPQQPLSRF